MISYLHPTLQGCKVYYTMEDVATELKDSGADQWKKEIHHVYCQAGGES